jgi:hypothetical protein
MTILDRTTGRHNPEASPVLDAKGILDAQALVREVVVADHVKQYAARLVLATHPEGDFALFGSALKHMNWQRFSVEMERSRMAPVEAMEGIVPLGTTRENAVASLHGVVVMMQADKAVSASTWTLTSHPRNATPALVLMLEPTVFCPSYEEPYKRRMVVCFDEDERVQGYVQELKLRIDGEWFEWGVYFPEQMSESLAVLEAVR